MTTLLGLDLAGRTVLVAGGGPVAARRARAMADDGAHVRVVAPQVCEDLRDLVAASLRARSSHRHPSGCGPTAGPRRAAASSGRRARSVSPTSRTRGSCSRRRTTRGPTATSPRGRRRAAPGASTPGPRTRAPPARRRRPAAATCSSGSSRTSPRPASRGRARSGATTGRQPGERRGADPRRARAVRDAIAEHLRSGGVDQRHHRPAPGGLGRVTLVGEGPARSTCSRSGAVGRSRRPTSSSRTGSGRSTCSTSSRPASR